MSEIDDLENVGSHRDEDVIDEDDVEEVEDAAEEESQSTVPEPVVMVPKKVKKIAKKVTKKVKQKVIKKVVKKIAKKVIKKIKKKPTPAARAMKAYEQKLKAAWPKKRIIKAKVKKEKKDKKPKKRGPKGAQWTRWDSPFQPSSTLAKLFKLLTAKGGIKHKVFHKTAKKMGGSPSWILGIYQKEQRRGWTWLFDDAHGKYRITDVEVNRKSHGKWW